MTTDLFGMFLDEIVSAIKPWGMEKYRAKQIAEWMYIRGVQDISLMANLPQRHRVLLAEKFNITSVKAAAARHSKDQRTSKYLLSFSDGAAVETVLMRQPYGNSVCVSTQVGCAMGCTFCASTLGGVVRDLSGGEILAQVLYCQAVLSAAGEHVTSIVIMGSGEPLANYDQTLRFIRLCHEPYCLNLSFRGITLSTSGLVPQIDRLAAEQLPVTLSVSLHAPNNEIRSTLMPVNKRYPIEEVMAAGDRYAARTGRRVTYEYILIAGVNDQDVHARELAVLMQGRLANVNLIPVNEVPERGMHRPQDERVQKFEYILSSARVNVTVRREMGADIQAACGQLRRQVLLAEK